MGASFQSSGQVSDRQRPVTRTPAHSATVDVVRAPRVCWGTAPRLGGRSAGGVDADPPAEPGVAASAGWRQVDVAAPSRTSHGGDSVSLRGCFSVLVTLVVLFTACAPASQPA